MENKVYKVTVVQVDTETNAEEIILDETYKGFALSAKCSDNRCAEVVMNDTVLQMAMRFAQGQHTKKAVLLAHALIGMKRDKEEEDESILRNLLEG